MDKITQKTVAKHSTKNAIAAAVEITSQPCAESPKCSAPKMKKVHPRTAEGRCRPNLATIPLPGPGAEAQIHTTREVDLQARAEETVASLTEAIGETTNT